MLLKVGDRGRKVIQEKGGQIAIDTLADQDALNGDVRGRSGQGVGRHLPAPVAEPVGQVVQGLTGLLAGFDAPRHRRDAGARIAEAQQLERTQFAATDAITVHR
jgi:hypothetical protein